MVKKKRGRILDAAHEAAKGLHDAGVMDETTMREYNAMCLPPVKQYTAKDIKPVRKSLHVSQPVFAAYPDVHRRALGAGVQEAPWPVIHR